MPSLPLTYTKQKPSMQKKSLSESLIDTMSCKHILWKLTVTCPPEKKEREMENLVENSKNLELQMPEMDSLDSSRAQLGKNKSQVT